jgi:hypothetical protein
MDDWPRTFTGIAYCGECGEEYPEEISSHAEGCTVAADMREAFDREHPDINAAIDAAWREHPDC